MELPFLSGSFAEAYIGADWSFRSVLFIPMTRYRIDRGGRRPYGLTPENNPQTRNARS